MYSDRQYSDIIIIGGGVVGCAVARALSRRRAGVTVLERGCDVAEGASKANSGIVHAGFDAKTGTNKARFNVEGSKMYAKLCAELDVPYRQIGAFVLAFSNEDRETVARLLAQGAANGVEGLRIVERDELCQMEPNVSPDALCALYAPTSAVVSPYELVYALADHAAKNGVVFAFDEEVKTIKREGDKWIVVTSKGERSARVVVNCAGVESARLHNEATGRDEYHIINRRGQYWLLDHLKTPPFSRTMFQCPTKMGKGVLVTPTVHYNTLIGPTAEDIADPFDTATSAEGLALAFEKSRRTWANVSTRGNITNFAGVRAHEAGGDFIIGAADGAPGLYEAVGIESPGLSSATAIAEYLSELIARTEHIEAKNIWLAPDKAPKPFNEMTDAERAEACERDEAYGRIVCRCETVTEAEILRAIRRPVGAKTIDGVKRRTRAGMGRCQGGFCSPRVAAILAEELGVELTQITKDGGASRLLVSDIETALKSAATDKETTAKGGDVK